MPDGWTYRARRLSEDLVLASEGEAVVLHDELQNNYQRREPLAPDANRKAR